MIPVMFGWICFALMVMPSFQATVTEDEVDEESFTDKEDFCDNYDQFSTVRDCWYENVPDVARKVSEHLKDCFGVKDDDEFIEVLTKECEKEEKEISTEVKAGRDCMYKKSRQIRDMTKDEMDKLEECVTVKKTSS